jgi:ATP-dependent DNA helicase RecQ
MIAAAKTVLKNIFGYDDFRFNQEKIIESILSKKDTLVLMPTGGGKSMCFQIPALLLEGITVVISPLIALMKDQVDSLKQNGVAAEFLNHTLSNAEQDEITQRIFNNKIKLLYVAPERLFNQNNQLLSLLKSTTTSLFAIDEAHCVSSWGHDFRPEYLQLSILKKNFPEVPVIALTATADALVKKDILEKIGLDQPAVFTSSFNRSNIHYFIEPKKDSFQKLLAYLKTKKNESGIIYCLSRKMVEEAAFKLQENGFSALPYHAGLERNTRSENQEKFLKDDVKIMVATIAFGMGIDKSNVRFVVHLNLPKNLESYYQETGRAGRDGLYSEALLYYSYGDLLQLKSFVTIEDNTEQSDIMLKKLDKMAEFCEIKNCRRKYLLNYFDEKFEGNCGSCDNCVSNVEKFDGTVEAQKILSAVTRLQQRFGVKYIAELLTGSENAKMRAEHKLLKTYGIGKEHSISLWINFIKEMKELGYLKQSDGEYPTILLGNKTDAILKGEEKVMFTKQKVVEKQKIIKTEIQLPPIETELFDVLRNLRKKIADMENVPPYIIFNDTTLNEMAAYLPLSEKDLYQINGWGEMKIKKYSKQFLPLIAQYCKEKNLTSIIDTREIKKVASEKKQETYSNTKKASYDLYLAGKSIAEIAKIRQFSMSTIENHLAYYVAAKFLDINKFITPEKAINIKKVCDEKGVDSLRIIKDELGDDYSYGEIRLAIASF